MATYQEIRQQVETLSADEQLRLLEELAVLVRHRAIPNLWQGQAEIALEASSSRWSGMSALEAARLVMGVIGDGPPDLSTNPKYMEGFGEA
jgi:hypothetical protein